MSLLTRRAVVLAKVETTYNVDANPSSTTDGFLVEAPDFTADAAVLKREFVRESLSPLPIIIGRKMSKLSFTTELRGNGKQNSGNIADVPVIARLFQACGYSLAAHATAWATPVFDVVGGINEVSWAETGALTNTDVIAYYITVVTGGPSGTATVTVTSDVAGESTAAPEEITSGTALDLGTKGLVLTPTWAGNLVAGQSWKVWAIPPGTEATPISDNVPSLTLYAYMDGTLHKLTGCLGTFSLDATGGQFAKIKWDFTGQYIPLQDTPIVAPTFERTLPAMVQLARLQIGGFTAVVNALTFNQANSIEVRPDINGTDAYDGVLLTARNPEGGIDPEATLVANNNFWGQLSEAETMPLQMRVGEAPGNTIWLLAPAVQYTKLTYKDRNGIRVYDAGLTFAQVNGDDEIAFIFI